MTKKDALAIRELIRAEIALAKQQMLNGSYPGTVGIEREKAFTRLAISAFEKLVD
jgi:hypothetical protein